MRTIPEKQFLVAVFAASTAVLILRRPETILIPEFILEEGGVFYVGTYFGDPLEVLTRPYAGYQHLLVRLFAYAERAVPVPEAPLVGNLLAIACVAGLATFVASSRLQPAARDRLVRLVAAALIVLLPNSRENVGVMVDLPRYVPVLLMAVALATAPATMVAKAVELAVMFVVTLSGAAGLMLQPLLWWRWWRRRDSYSAALAAMVLGASVLQVASLLVDGRRPGNFESPAALIGVHLYRSTLGALLGQGGASLVQQSIPLFVLIGVSAGVLGALIILWWRAIPADLHFPLAFAWIALTLSTLLAQREGAAVLAVPMNTGRYYLIPAGLMLGTVAIALVRLRGKPGWPLAVTLALVGVVGLTADVRVPAIPEQGWRERSTCIGGETPCTVPVWSPETWTIHWPGIDGQYVQPRPGA